VKTFVETLDINDHQYLQLNPPLGRFTELQTEPLMLLDGAHNENGIKNLILSFQKKYPTKKPKVLVGFSMMKNFQENLKILTESFGTEVYLTEFEHFKS
jgi:dihydrofolate synthase/folylpolyglutamate synthase